MPLYDNSLKEVCKDFFRQSVGIFWFCWLFASSWLLPAGRWLVLSLLGVVSILPLPRYSGGVRFLVLPPAAYFPAMESRQRSPGLRARTRGRGAAVGIRGLQILWLLPAVLASALNTSAIGPSGGYPPCKTWQQLPCLWLYSCRLSDYQPLHDGFGVEAAGVFFLAFSFARQRDYLRKHEATGFSPHRLNPKSIK